MHSQITVTEFKEQMQKNLDELIWRNRGWGPIPIYGKGEKSYSALSRYQYNVDSLQKLKSQGTQDDKTKARIANLEARIAKSGFAPPKDQQEAEKQAGKNPIDPKGKSKEQLVREFAVRGAIDVNGKAWITNTPEWITYHAKRIKKEELIDKVNFYNTYGHVNKWTGNADRVNDILLQTSTKMMRERKIYNKTDAEEKYGMKFNALSEKWKNYVKGQKYGYIPENKAKEAAAYMTSLYKELDHECA